MKRIGILCLLAAFVFVLPAVHAEGEKEEEPGNTKVTVCHITGATKTVETDLGCKEKCKVGKGVLVCVTTKVVALHVDEDAVDAHVAHGDFVGKKCPAELVECHCECVEDDGKGEDEGPTK